MDKLKELKKLVKTFTDNLSRYKNSTYNESDCRREFIDRLLELLGWDVRNEQGIAPQYREVIAEQYSNSADRPDYTLTLHGVTKIFVEAKKPSVEIEKVSGPAFQARRYGWNANHKIVVLTNFEYLSIYDATVIPNGTDTVGTALYKQFEFTEYVDRFDELKALLSKEVVYNGQFDIRFSDKSFSTGHQMQKVDELFLNQINDWRIKLSKCLYSKIPADDKDYIEVMNDQVQLFINQIVFLRICEDRNLPLYHKLIETKNDKKELIKLLKESDKRYNSGLFSDYSIYSELDENLINEILEGLYYPQSPYLFNIIEPNLLGKIYEQFLTKKLIIENEEISLTDKKDYAEKSIVSTPIEIVKYIVDKTLKPLCGNKTPKEILTLKVADIACGSGVFLEEAFDYLVKYCESWYEKNQKNYLIELSDNNRKLPLEDKKEILLSCIFGIDIDVHAVEVSKFSLLIKLIENETEPSVAISMPILPNLDENIKFGNSLVEEEKIQHLSNCDYLAVSPFSWKQINNGNKFSAIIGNPPYVKTEDMHTLLPDSEFDYYLNNFTTPHKQFDKYFLFIEQAINKTFENGRVGMIVPNKFFKIETGKKLRELLAINQYVESIDDFGDSQVFADKTIYSCILCINKSKSENFLYSRTTSLCSLWGGVNENNIVLPTKHLKKSPWRLSPDIDFLKFLNRLDKYSIPLSKHAEIFNGIQTSAERPLPIYWFYKEEIIGEDKSTYTISREGKTYKIEKDILRPYFKPTKKAEKGLNSYSDLISDKQIIFPYDSEGKLISLDVMKSLFPNTLNYLNAYYSELEPKQLNSDAKRDVPGATKDSWYQYGRSQSLTSFINTPKLIVGVLSKEPMYAFDDSDMLIASGGTAGYCSITEKEDSPYELAYIQAWLANPYTEKYLKLIGSDFENGFTARGTAVLKTIPFVPIDLSDEKQKKVYDSVVSKTKRIYELNKLLRTKKDKKSIELYTREKNSLIDDVQQETDRIWNLEFLPNGGKNETKEK